MSGITPFAGGYRPTFFSVDPVRQKNSRSEDRQGRAERRLQTALAKDNDANNDTHSGSLPCAVDRGALRGRARVVKGCVQAALARSAAQSIPRCLLYM